MYSLSSQILCTLNLSDVTRTFHIVTVFVLNDLQRKMLVIMKRHVMFTLPSFVPISIIH